MTMAQHHYLKIHPKHMADRRAGIKPVEIRKNDRDFQLGDYIHLLEYAPGFGYLPNGGETAGNNVVDSGQIDWLTDFGMAEGFVCLHFK